MFLLAIVWLMNSSYNVFTVNSWIWFVLLNFILQKCFFRFLILTPLHSDVADLTPLHPDVADLPPLHPDVADLTPLHPDVADLTPLHPDVADL